MKRTRKVARFILFWNQTTVKIGAALSVFFFLLMFLILVIEKKQNPALQSFFDAFWYTFVTVTTIGYGDITPVTVGGRIVALIIMSSGVVIFGGVSGKIASVLFDQQQKRDKGLIALSKKEGHFIICGWKPDLESIISGILHQDQDYVPSDLVLVNTASQELMYPILNNVSYRGISYINGDFSDEDTLNRANVSKAARILLLSDHSRQFSAMEMDSKNVLAVLSVKKLNKTIYTAAELIDPKFYKHLENEHCDEIILSKQYERSILVSASTGYGISHVIEHLFGVAGGQGGLSIRDIPESLIGKSFAEAAAYFNLHDEGILAGVLENTGNFFLRKQEALGEAQKNPDIAEIVNNLKKVKVMKSNRTVLAPPKDYPVKPYSKAILIRQSIDIGEVIT